MNRELIIGFILAKQGAKVFVLMDDGALKHWDSYKAGKLVNDNTVVKGKTSAFEVVSCPIILKFSSTFFNF